MGAAQSKKRRKERKRKRKQCHHGGGISSNPSISHFDVPRSLSLDALRVHGVTSPSSAAACLCPHCGGWSWAVAATGGDGGHDPVSGRRAERRTFSGVLESSGVCHGFHRCLRGQYDHMHGSRGEHRADGYHSDDGGGGERFGCHLACPACSSMAVSDESVMSFPSAARMQTTSLACPGPEHSTMSLNRHAGLRVRSKMSQTRSAEFSELLEILRQHEELRPHQRGTLPINAAPRQPHSHVSQPVHPAACRPPGEDTMPPAIVPDQSNRIAVSQSSLNTVEAPVTEALVGKSPPPPPPLLSTMPTSPTSPGNGSTQLTTGSDSPAKSTTTTATTTVGPVTGSTAPKKPVTVLEDEETRLARWEKQKLMVEQFRLLRKHLLAREASSGSNSTAANDSNSLPLSLKGPLDAVETYLSDSNSKFSARAEGSSSSLSKKGGMKPPVVTTVESGRVLNTSAQMQNTSYSSVQTSSIQSGRSTAESVGAGREEIKEKMFSTSSSSTFSSSRRVCKDINLVTTAGVSSALTSTSPQQQSTTPLRETLSTRLTPTEPTQLQWPPPSGRSQLVLPDGSFRYLDNHPVLSRLQNEQNSRLERMERRMRSIRVSAEQEAERRKFAQIFPAQPDVLVEDERRKMREAEEALARLKEENDRIKRMRKKAGDTVEKKGGEAVEAVQSRKVVKTTEDETLPLPSVSSPDAVSDASKDKDSRGADDSGEVIPVQVLQCEATDASFELGDGSTLTQGMCQSNNTQAKADQQIEEAKPQDTREKPHWLNSTFPNLDLGNPLMWLVLPFLLFPLILRLLLSVAMSTKPAPPLAAGSTSGRSGSPSPSQGPSSDNCDGGGDIMTQGPSSSTELVSPPTALTERKGWRRKCSSKVKGLGTEPCETKMLKST